MDIVFGLFAICGYQFSPRIADIFDARLRRTNTAADYGPLQPVSKHRASASTANGQTLLAAHPRAVGRDLHVYRLQLSRRDRLARCATARDT